METKKKQAEYYDAPKMTHESFKEKDKATEKAGVGNRFAGGTARRAAAPFPGQLSMAIELVLKEKADPARAEPSSGGGGRGPS